MEITREVRRTVTPEDIARWPFLAECQECGWASQRFEIEGSAVGAANYHVADSKHRVDVVKETIA